MSGLPKRERLHDALDALLDGRYEGYAVLDAYCSYQGEDWDEETSQYIPGVPLADVFRHIADLAKRHAAIPVPEADPPDFGLIEQEEYERGEREFPW